MIKFLNAELLLVLLLVLTGCMEAKIEKLEGPAGRDGKDGQSCTVSQAVNGAVILCPDGTSVMVLNGLNGINGVNGIDGLPAPASNYTIVGVIDPCGKQGQFDEILLRLANGQLVAHYASGNNQFLTTIGPNNYITTDGTSCRFTVNNNLEVVNEHN